MQYTSLYRRYRPDTFAKLFGQDHVVRTLTNQIKSGKIGHAYLFTGTRGTGKTSTAKIFAKAVNCLNPIDGSPCHQCEVCKALSSANNMDILEIDAASNNGVDEIRELRDSVNYPPVHGKYKVYIIDEVHMLSTSAFNALLKTLEEPPRHVIFILATTEVHKLPSTILSRCMRFDFRLVSHRLIAKHLQEIFDELGKGYDQEAIDAIAEAAEGSVRDSLSIADMCMSASDDKLTYADVLDILGASDKNTLLAISRAVLAGDTREVLANIDKAVSMGRNVNVLARDLTATFRDIMLAKLTGVEDTDLAESYRKAVLDIANNSDKDKIIRALDIMASLENDMRYTLNPRTIVEAACIRATLIKTDLTIDGLLMRINALENKLAGVNVSSTSASPQVQSVGMPRASQVPSDAPRTARGIWSRAIGTLKENKYYALYSCMIGIDKVRLEDTTLIVTIANPVDYNMLNSDQNHKIIQDTIIRDCGEGYRLVFENVEADTSLSEAVSDLKRMVGEDSLTIHK